MTSPRPGQPWWRRPRTRRLACTLAAVTTPLALTVPAAAHPAAAHRAASTSPAAASSALTALHSNAPVTVTLVTGDVIQLTRGPSGHISVTSQPAPRAGGGHPMIRVTSLSKRGHTPTIYALPTDASALIAAGRVSKNLFNIGYLTAAENAAATRNTVPVVIQYGGRLTARELAARAGQLPGASVRAVLPGSNAAEVNLDTRDAARFWAVLTGGHTPATQAAPRPALAGGVTRIWLAGHQTPSQPPAQPAGAPTYPVTITIYGHTNPGPAETDCQGTTKWRFCAFSPDLLGVAGGGADNIYWGGGSNGASWSCLDQNPCNTIQIVAEVPAGVYSLETDGGWYSDGQARSSNFIVTDPQFTVAGPTQVAFHLDDLVPVKVSTSRPGQAAQLGQEFFRALPDGTSFWSGAIGFYGTSQELWTIPTSQPVTIGTFDLGELFDLIQPPVTMRATTPEHLTLDPIYPNYTSHFAFSTAASGWAGSAIRFSGQQTLPLVDVGTGSAADFAGRDVRGKLVLMTLPTIPRGHVRLDDCSAGETQLQNALHAGAAGVLVDPIYIYTPVGADTCIPPVQPAWWIAPLFGLKLPVVHIPYVSIPPPQATALRQLMNRGPVGITVTDNGQSPYAYYLQLEQNGQVPASLPACCTSRQLTTVTANYHADSPQPWGVGDNSVFYAFGTADQGGVGVEDSLGAPFTRQEYMLSAPDMVQYRETDGTLGPATHQVAAGGSEYHVFDKPDGSETWNWLDRPQGPGLPAAPTDVFAAQPGRLNGLKRTGLLQGNYTWCNFCRQGNSFYPLFTRTSGATPRVGGNLDGYTDPSTIHLYANGQELPPDTSLPFVSYQLPARQARYKLAATDGITSDTWDFTSAGPATDTRPEGTLCLGDLLSFPSQGPPCAAPPLILLNYDAGLSLNNTVTAPGAHRLQITAYEEAANAPRITTLQAWTSTDGGNTWQPAQVSGGRDGSYTAAYTVPQLSATSGTASLKVHASDAVGNDVTQVIKNAYGLTASGP
jgi:hypothetical protein